MTPTHKQNKSTGTIE